MLQPTYVTGEYQKGHMTYKELMTKLSITYTSLRFLIGMMYNGSYSNVENNITSEQKLLCITL